MPCSYNEILYRNASGTSAVAQRTLLDMVWNKLNVVQKNTCYTIPFTSSSKARKTKGSREVSEWCLAVGGPRFRDIAGRRWAGGAGKGHLGMRRESSQATAVAQGEQCLDGGEHSAVVLTGKVHIKHLQCLSRDTVKQCQLLLLSSLILY